MGGLHRDPRGGRCPHQGRHGEAGGNGGTARGRGDGACPKSRDGTGDDARGRNGRDGIGGAPERVQAFIRPPTSRP